MKLARQFAFALATLLLPVVVQAAQLTYEIRLDPATSSPGVVIANDHSAIVNAPGDVVGVLLYAVILDNNGNHADDGFTGTFGSFVAGGALVGDLRGDTNFVLGGATQQNNVVGANAGIAQSGFAFDLNGDGGLDVGDLTNHGTSPVLAPWFIAVGGSGAGGTTFGSGAGVGPTEILIGRTTFTAGAGTRAGQTTQVNYVPRQWTTGGLISARKINKFVLDGVVIGLTSDDANIATVGASIMAGLAPPPSQPPVVTTGNASDIGTVAATLTGTVNPNGSVTAAKFQVGLAGAAYNVDLPVVLSPTNGGVAQTVSAQDTGLTPGTAYHYRLVATNSGGTTAGEDKVFTTAALVPQPPAVVTGTATNVGAISVTLNGTVNPAGEPTTVKFESGTTSAYGTDTPVTFAPNDGTLAVPVSATLIGLTPGTSYHFRVSATNGEGTTVGADMTFTTQPVPANPLLTYEIRLDPATSSPGVVIANSHSAIVSAPGDVVGVLLYAVISNGNGNHADDGFTGTFGSFVAGGALVGDLRGDTNFVAGGITQQNNVAGANAGVAQSGFAFDLNGDGGLDVGDITNFGASPTVAPWFIAVGGSGAGGTTFGSGASAGPTEILIGRTTFTAGAGTQAGQTTQVNYVPRLYTSGPFTVRRINKFVLDGVAFGLTSDDINIATVGASIMAGLAPPPSQPPVVTTGNASDIGMVAATLTGTVNPNGGVTTAKFQVGPAGAAYNVDLPVVLSPTNGGVAQTVSAQDTGLTPGTAYHYRLVATNSGGTTTGEDKVFTTAALVPQPPVAVTGTATNIGTMSVILNGTVNPAGEPTTVKFESGTTSAYGTGTPVTFAPNDGTTAVPVSATLSGLTPGTSYHFRISATNGEGTTVGADMTFTTQAVPANPLLTYEIRIDPATSSHGVTVVDAHTAAVSSVSDEVGLQLYAVLANNNGNNADDGFIQTNGSFVADGSLGGDLRGDTTGGLATQQNNVPGASAGISQSGFAADLNGNGGLDVGDIANHGTAPVPAPWFIAVGGTGAGGTTFGTGASPGRTEILIGRTTYKIAPSAVFGSSTQINYVPRQWTTGGLLTARKLNKFVVDGLAFSLTSDDANIATVGASITAPAGPVVPPPVVTTGAAKDILATNAYLAATVTPNSTATTVKFQSGLTSAYDTATPATISPFEPGTARPVTAKISGLSPNTMYHYRVSATNSGGTVYGEDMTFTTPAALTPQILAGVQVLPNGPTSVTLKGTVNPRGSPTTAVFQSGATTAYGTNTAAAPDPGDGGLAKEVSTTLTGLTPNTTYHFRLSATNQAGTVNSTDMPYHTDVLRVPTVVTNPATTIGAATATLNGTASFQLGQSGVAKFQYGLTGAYGSEASVVAGTSPWVSAALTGLAPDTTYHYRITATNDTGTSNGEDMTFTTLAVDAPQPPFAGGTDTGGITYSTTKVTTRFSALVCPNGVPTTAKFQLGTTQNYGTDIPVTLSPNDGTTLLKVISGIITLQPNTTYHCRLSATNAAGTTYGTDRMFSTAGLVSAPVIGDIVADCAFTSVVLHVTLNSGGSSTAGTVEYGPTTSYGSSHAATFGTGNNTITYVIPLSNLTPGTTYHCRLTATNSMGTTVSPDVTFTTLSLPAGPWLIYEMRVDPAGTSPGVVVSADRKSAQCNGPGDVVALQLFAVLNNADGNHADDGFTLTVGSFVASSAGGLVGDLRGDTHFVVGGATQQNNVPGANAAISQSGFVFDLDGDGGLDVGNITNHGPAGNPAPWFWAVGGTGAGGTTFGQSTGAEPTAILIGQTTYTVAATAQPGQASTVNYVPRLFNTGGLSGEFNTNRFVLDGVNFSLRSDHANVVVAAPVAVSIAVAPTPQPPVVVSGSATDVTATGAILHGTVNPRGLTTTASFQSGLTDAYGTETAVTLAPADGSAAQSVSTALTGLTPNTTYHFRISATNSAGPAEGDDVTFTTLADAIPPTIAAPEGGFVPLTLNTGVDGKAALPDYTGQVVAGDNVGVTGVTQTPAPGAVNAGPVHVVLTAHDAAGNTADTAFDVTVLDGTAPVITHVPDSVGGVADAGGTAPVPDITGGVTATDNVAVVSITQAPPAGASVGVGQTEIVVTVADAAGNTATAGVIFNVLAVSEPPVDRGRGFYSGLLDDGVGSADGLVTLLVGGGGGFSGKASLHGVTKGFQGFFHNDAALVGIPGFGSLALARKSGGGIDLSLGEFTGLAENSPFTLFAPAPMRGSYTVLLPPDPAHAGDAAFPQGTGFATLKVNQLGLARCVGRLGDGVPIAFDTSVHGDGTLPCYDGLYTAPRGSIVGTLAFRDLAGSDLDGALAWSKPVQTGGPGLFRSTAAVTGFSDLAVPAVGSFYQLSTTPLGMLTYGKTRRATVTFHDGGLPAPMSGTATVRTTPSAFVTPPMRELIFSPGEGVFVGSLRPGAPGGGPRPFFGVVFQKQNRSAGFFIGAGTVGGVDYTPQQ